VPVKDSGEYSKRHVGPSGDGLGAHFGTAGPVDGDVDDAVLVQPEDDAALQRRGRVVEVDDRRWRRERLEGALDQVLARLGQHLDRDVVGDQVLLDQLRTKSKSVCEADGKPTSISL
jgi:hypothetical protein